MTQNNIKPEKITKPIQLLAVWLLGLILLVSAFLTAAGTIKHPDWLPALFGISALSIIPLFLILIFLLQTRFRPQMQEDSFYSEYLNKNTLEMESRSIEETVAALTTKIDDKIVELSSITQEQISILSKTIIDISGKAHLSSALTSELRTQPTKTFEKFMNDSTTNIQVNVKLNNLSDIITFLNKHSLKVDRLFGDSEKHEIPKVALLSFGMGVNVDVLKETVDGLKGLGLTHIKLAEGPISKHNIYIGSYAYKSGGMAELSKSLIEKIINSISIQEIYAHITSSALS